MLLFAITWGSISGWWTPVCLIAGLLYAFLLYRQPVMLAPLWRNLLFAARALAVFLLGLLLVSPLIKNTGYQPQKPLVLVVQDNSASINLFKKTGFDSKQFVNGLSQLKKALGDDYDVRSFHFGGGLADGFSDRFDAKQTDISAALAQLNDRFTNQNIGAIVLATDGLYNHGADPQYMARNIKSPFYTIALGDTVARRDLLIGNINYNKTAFLGDDFVVEILAEAYQSNGETMHLTVDEDGRTLTTQNIPVNSADFKKVIPVKLTADKKGVHRYSVKIAPANNEVSVQNNTDTFYVEVIDSKQKILLVYDGPHPDISVIKQGIESNRNYSVKTVLTADLNTIKPADYSLIIFYQTIPQGLTEGAGKAHLPAWYIMGAQADVNAFKNAQKLLNVSIGRQDMQEVFGRPVNDFTLFSLSDSSKNIISKLPPLLAPFGTYSASAVAQTLLRQTIGSIATTYPLLVLGDDNGKRTAVLAGEGLWRWQLAEFQLQGNHHAVEELLSQTVQYLTANANKQRFRVYAPKNVFDEGENVLLNAELYNDALELVNTPDIKIELKNADGKNYSFLFSRTDKSYQLNAGTLPAGEYSYSATTALGKQNFKAEGKFAIKPLNLETRQTAANTTLLRNIAAQSGGRMLQPSQLNQLLELIRKNDNIKTIVYEDKHYSDLIDLKWVFVLILVLLSGEWFLRKREGVI